MALRVSKTVLVIGAVLLGLGFVGALGAGGYMIWRLNQNESITPGEAEAADCCTSPGATQCSGTVRQECGAAINNPCGTCDAEGFYGCWVRSGTQEWCDADGTLKTCGNMTGGACCDGSSCGDDTCSACENTKGNCEEDCVTTQPPGENSACNTCSVGSTCDWCSEGRENCQCSDFGNDGGITCWTHAGSGCMWEGTSADGSCVCNSGATGCNISGTASSFRCDTGPCNVSVGSFYRDISSHAECLALAHNGVGGSTTPITLSTGQSYSQSPAGSCGIYQIDATGCGWNGLPETGCVWDATCDAPVASCGDGTCDSGETCETNGNKACPSGTALASGVTCRSNCTYCGDGTVNGSEACDAPGNSSQCPGGAICTSSCTCPSVSSTYLNVTGQVYCQDTNGERYPITGANLQFTKASGSESLTTNSSGIFASQASTTTAQGPFALQYSGLSTPDHSLPTGVLYSEMVGPVVDNSGICTSGKCATCATSYSNCAGLTTGMNGGFNWKFTGCSLEEVNPEWTIRKDSTVACYQEQTINAFAEVSYTITVTNIEGGGAITTIVDDIDAAILDTWVSNLNPSNGVVSGGTITWSGVTFSVGETKTFTYKVRIPSTLFGNAIDNHVVVTPESGGQLHAYSTAIVACGEYTPPLPGTGLFDSTVARIGLGVLLVGMGFAYYKFGLFDGAVNWLTRGSDVVGKKVRYTVGNQGKQDRWEKKLLKKAERTRKP